MRYNVEGGVLELVMSKVKTIRITRGSYNIYNKEDNQNADGYKYEESKSVYLG